MSTMRGNWRGLTTFTWSSVLSCCSWSSKRKSCRGANKCMNTGLTFVKLRYTELKSHNAVTLCCLWVFLSRREQSLDKKYPGLFKHHSSRQSSSSNSMDKLIKKRNVPQKLPSGKRCELKLVLN